MEAKQHTLFITGAAGYVGTMLAEQFSKRADVARIVCLDKEPMPELLSGNKAIVWITDNTATHSWQERVKDEKPDIVIHTAWQIRQLYGHKKLEWEWNIDGSNNVFDFALEQPSVERLIHFSTVASYGAFKENSVTHFYKEDEPFRKSKYLYAEEKRISEEHLEKKSSAAVHRAQTKYISIVRPAAITGPRGRYARIRFGLQAALSGSLKSQKSFLYSFISLWVSWVPVTKKWLRQYVHEDDVTDIVAELAFGQPAGPYEAYNLAPPGSAVMGADMARAVGKKTLPIYPWMAAVAFFFMWHGTRGRIPTAPGSWRGYSYPIAVDGSKVSKKLGYQYKYNSKDAFTKKEGRYAYVIPQESI